MDLLPLSFSAVVSDLPILDLPAELAELWRHQPSTTRHLCSMVMSITVISKDVSITFLYMCTPSSPLRSGCACWQSSSGSASTPCTSSRICLGGPWCFFSFQKENTGITKPGPAKDFKRWPKVAVSVNNETSFSVTVFSCSKWCCNLFQVHWDVCHS